MARPAAASARRARFSRSSAASWRSQKAIPDADRAAGGEVALHVADQLGDPAGGQALEDDRELVVAGPGEVGEARGLRVAALGEAEHGRDVGEQAVAGRMAPVLVEGSEPVEVEDGDGQRDVPAAGGLEPAGQLGDQRPAIRAGGEEVGVGHRGEAGSIGATAGQPLDGDGDDDRRQGGHRRCRGRGPPPGRRRRRPGRGRSRSPGSEPSWRRASQASGRLSRAATSTALRRKPTWTASTRTMAIQAPTACAEAGNAAPGGPRRPARRQQEHRWGRTRGGRGGSARSTSRPRSGRPRGQPGGGRPPDGEPVGAL